MPEDTTRRSFLTAAGTGMAAAIAGCAGNEPADTDTETATATEMEGTDEPTDSPTPTEEELEETGGVLQMASPGPVQTLDPINAKGSGAGYNQYQESLLYFPDGDLPPQGELAADYTISDDGVTYTFELQEGVQFHDGAELTAADAVYSFRRLAESENSRNRDDIIGGTMRIAHDGPTQEEGLSAIEPGSLAVRAVDDYTFEFDMAEPFHGTLSNIAGGAFGIIPENSVGDIEGYDGEYEYNVFFSTDGSGPEFVGTGPYEVDSWSKGDSIELTAFDDYHGEGPLIDGIVYTVIGDDQASYQRFQQGNLDILGPGSATFPSGQFDPALVDIERDRGSYRVGTYGPMENGETVNYGEATALDTDYIVFNCDRTERAPRQAIAYLLNQHDIAETIFKGLADPAYHITPPPVFPSTFGASAEENYTAHAESGEFSNTDFGADGYPFGYAEADIQAATEVMEEAGYSESDPYEITFTIFSGDSTWQQLSTRLRDKAEAAHISIEITEADFGTIIGKAINGEMDMFSLGDGMEWPESDNFLRFLHPTADSPMFTRWNPPEEEWNDFQVQAEDAWQRYLENKGPGESEQEARDDAYMTIEEMNWASVQELPLVHSISQRFWYDDVDLRMFGTMENQTYNTLELNRE